MKCVRCHRTLRNPTSVINGMGPVCWAKQNGGARPRMKKQKPVDKHPDMFEQELSDDYSAR